MAMYDTYSYNDFVGFIIESNSNHHPSTSSDDSTTNSASLSPTLLTTSQAEISENTELTSSVIAGVVFLVGFLGFLNVTISLLRHKKSSVTTSHWYLFNLSISGGILFVSLLLVIAINFSKNNVKLTEDLQKLQGMVFIFNFFSSLFFFTLISVDQYLSTCKSGSQLTTKFHGKIFTYIASFSVWGISLFICVLVAFHNVVNKIWHNVFWAFFIVTFVACLIISAFCLAISVIFSLRLSAVLRNSVSFSVNTDQQIDAKINNNVTIRDHSSVTMLSAIMVTTFFIGWIPFIVKFAGNMIPDAVVTTSSGFHAASAEFVVYIATAINWYIYVMADKIKPCCVKHRKKQIQVRVV